jgi:hypothetical protein
MGVSLYVTSAWENVRNYGIGAELGIRKTDKDTKGKKSSWNIYRGSHQKELSITFKL